MLTPGHDGILRPGLIWKVSLLHQAHKWEKKIFLKGVSLAVFVVHPDTKLHYWIIVFVVGIMVFTASRKWKCITKSPMESELVALTYHIGLAKFFKEFVSLSHEQILFIKIVLW